MRRWLRASEPCGLGGYPTGRHVQEVSCRGGMTARRELLALWLWCVWVLEVRVLCTYVGISHQLTVNTAVALSVNSSVSEKPHRHFARGRLVVLVRTRVSNYSAVVGKYLARISHIVL